MDLFVLSELRPRNTHVGWSVSSNLEATLAEVLNPIFIYPELRRPLRDLEESDLPRGSLAPLQGQIKRFFRRTSKSWFTLPSLPTLGKGPNILLVIGLTPEFLYALPTLEPILKQFDLRIAYFLDGFDPRWLDPALVARLDHLFVISKELTAEVEQLHQISTTFLPIAVDTTKFNPNSLRLIDVLSYGRNNTALHQRLQKHFIQMPSERLYFHSTFAYGDVESLPAHTALMSKLLCRSKISLCFEASNIERFRGQSPLLYRWFEAWAAGCTIVGRQPFGEGVAELMDWENSTIDLPVTPSDWVPFLEMLLDDEATLALNARRNHQESILRHDWRYRIKNMLASVDLPIPETLNRSIELLQQQALDCSEVLKVYT